MNKRWNPYCWRHSAIREDAETLSADAVDKKVGWRQGSKMRKIYVDKSFGQSLKNQILIRDGYIIDNKTNQTLLLIVCNYCKKLNGIDTEVCECGAILSQTELNRRKEAEKERENEMKEMRKEIVLIKFNQFVDKHLEKVQREREYQINSILEENDGKLDCNIDGFTFKPEDQINEYLKSDEGKRLTLDKKSILDEFLKNGNIKKCGLLGVGMNEYNNKEEFY